MPISKIDICNLGLAHLGAAPIRSFDEQNKRSRMANTFFEADKELLLRKFDWPFARKAVVLSQVIIDGPIPDGQYAYERPSDCLVARDIDPEGKGLWWKVVGKQIYTMQSTATLHYTWYVTDTTFFSSTFSSLLALKLAIHMCPPITQDTKLLKMLQDMYTSEQYENWEPDANEGSEYRRYDEQPDNDTFVNPEGRILTQTGEEAR